MKTNIYLLVDPDKPHICKIGISKNTKQRLKAYRTAAPHCYFLVVYLNVHRKHEKLLIELIKDIAQVSSEVIHLSPWLVKNICDSYFVDKNIEVKTNDY